jgi:transposase
MSKRDARTLGQEAQYELRRRTIALKRKGHSHQEVADLLEVSISAVRKTWKLYKDGGVRALRLGQRGRRLGTQRTLSVEEERKLRKMIIDRTPEQLKMPFALWTRQAVLELIEKQCGVKMPIRTVGEYLRRWGFTPQRPRKRAYDQQPAAVKQWLKATYPKIAKRAKKEGAEILWCDETGVSSEDHRGRGYAPQGSTPVVHTKAARFSSSMISALTNRGALRFMVYKGALKIPIFLQFLKRLVRSSDKKVFLILDNLRVHKAKAVRAWVEENEDKIELFYIPPYSPELNPDEYLNNAVKGRLRTKPAPQCLDELQGNLRRCMKSIQRKPKFLRSLFHHPSVKYAAA